MRPELFKLPFISITIKSYGTMMVIGFLCALYLARWRARKLNENPLNITNFAVYILIAGVIGARIMEVVLNFSDYRDNLWAIFMFWRGGLAFVGGVILALPVMIIYCRKMKLPTLKYLDILAPAVMLGLAFGRIGCLLNGCCFGQPANLPWAIQFPVSNTYITQEGPEERYSIPYLYQLTPDPCRPDQPNLNQVLPAEYFSFYLCQDGVKRTTDPDLKKSFSPDILKNATLVDPIPYAYLADQQRKNLHNNQKYHMHPIHPAQVYSSISALFLCLILTLLFRFYKFHGQIIASMLILYGITRFLLEMVRCEPFFINHFTASQTIGMVSTAIGVILLLFLTLRSKTTNINMDALKPGR